MSVVLGMLAALSISAADHPLAGLQFRNSGTVRHSMQFRYFKQPVRYAEDLNSWNVTGAANYLYRVEDGKKSDPPVGMRSAVPLGGLGSGTLELRADGSFHDWNIFNNSPAAGTPIELDDALFGIRVREHGVTHAFTLRTHPPANLPAISQIEYSGAFPAARLRFSDPAVALKVELYAYSEFYPRDEDASATPAAIFTFLLHNPTNHAAGTSLLFAIPNYAGGRQISGKCLTLRTEGDGPLSGTIALYAATQEGATQGAVASGIDTLWQEFSALGRVNGVRTPGAAPRYGAVTARTCLQPGATQTVTFVLAWYFPFRRHRSEMPGNYYARLYRDADDVAEKVLGRLSRTWLKMRAWQRTIFENSLPEWLQDALVNSVATMYKTGIRFHDGRWRQWESFSCANIEPEHIHFYRSLPYAFFFPDLQKQLLAAHGQFQREDGFVYEQLATGCFALESDLDHLGGREMGDSASDFLLEAWQIWTWGGDRAYLDSIWPRAKKAAEWQVRRSLEYGLPRNLENTYDWWDFAKKDIVSYNAFLY